MVVRFECVICWAAQVLGWWVLRPTWRSYRMATEPAQSVSPSTSDGPSSQPLVGKGWIQGVALVMIFGFTVMGILAYRTYTASMPLPNKVVSQSGQVLFTGAQITRGQELFQARGLQEYGSVVGHGAYLGPDFTAE